MKSAVIVASLCVAGLAMVAAYPQFASQYMVAATMSLPYAKIVEPVLCYFDGVGQRQRLDYYQGLDVYIYRSDLNVQWQVSPVITQQMCFQTNGTVDLTSMLPDLSSFSLQPQPVVVNGVTCQNWQLIQRLGSRWNTYNFYYDASNAMPVQYHMMGYDSLLGSHYDEYVVDYQSYATGAQSLPPGIFDQPAMPCGDFPGPGATPSIQAPLAEIRDLFPGVSADGVAKPFAEFMAAFGKSYSSEKELAKRQTAFMRNFRFVQAARRNPDATFTMTLNKFADLTEEEMNARRGITAKPRERPANNGAQFVHEAPADLSAIPASVDWRTKGAVSPVKDQGICGSCWTFGTVGTLEGSYFLKYGGSPITQFSEQELVDCVWPYGTNGCGGGEDWRAYSWIMANGGLATSAAYGPYLMQDGWCAANKTASTLRIKGYVNVTSGDESALMSAIATYGPISVAIDASHESLSFYSSGVYYEPQCKNGPNDLDHAVLAVGYGTAADGQDYWIIKNSWSTHWGDQGYVKMSRKNNNCGVATAATYAILA